MLLTWSVLALAAPPVVATPNGVVVGRVDASVRSFLGVPFAEPPVGNLRFRPPVPVAPWAAPLDARAYGSECPQRSGGAVAGDEDCLNLNVWTPVGANALPVMVFVHGGSFTSGSGSISTYDGANLVQTDDVVVVTINYRLGSLGYLATPGLQAENADGRIGNQGLQDQILALQWVRDQIASFGGDPAQVTVFGESAGGMSVCALIGAPEADGLFSTAIVQSGGGCDGFPVADAPTLNNPSMVQSSLDFASAVGCGDDPACLRGLPVSALLDPAVQPVQVYDPVLVQILAWHPVVDGVVLPADPIERIVDGSRADLSLVLGSNDEEFDVVMLADPAPTAASFRAHVTQVVGPGYAQDLERIYLGAGMSSQVGWATFVDELMFTCPALATAEIQVGDAWAYHFTHTLAGPAAVLGSFHALELPYVFANLSAAPSAADRTVADDMSRQWTTLALTGAPDAQRWPAIGSTRRSVAEFSATGTTLADPSAGRCGELRGLGLIR